MTLLVCVCQHVSKVTSLCRSIYGLTNMALVEYESSSDESENETPSPSTTPDATTNLLLRLPQTKSFKLASKAQSIDEDVIEDFIPKSKVRPKVKITIPSLSEFAGMDDEEEPKSKKIKPSNKGSGLIAMLPPVRGAPLTSKTFIPKVLTDKMKTTITNSTLVPHSVRLKADAKKAEIMKKMMRNKNASDAESDDDEEMVLPDSFDDEMWQKVCGRQKAKKTASLPKAIEPEAVLIESINIAPEPEQKYEGLDNEAFKELVGKNKRPLGNIKLIDINESEILSEDKDLWLQKSLTDPECVPKKSEEVVDPTKRKKHHITYLAQQAKANEQELQSQWASSKNNRTQTRAKYGF